MKRKFRKKELSLLISIMLLATITAGGTLAFIVTHTDGITNTFLPAEVTCEITETMQDNIKSGVSIKNTGDTDAYIRVAIIATWQDDSGNVSAEPVESSDYTITFTEDNKWIKYGEYWYYPLPIAPGENTADLIESCYPISEGPDGYTLHVEIVADAVQATPADAVSDAWGVTISEGSVIAVNN